MTANDTLNKETREMSPRIKELRRFSRVFFGRPLVVLGSIVIFIFIITAIFAPWLAPYDPYEQDLDNILLQPCKSHLLGTDVLGRDTLSRLIYGSQTAILVGVVALSIAATIGMLLGIVAGYYGGLTYAIIMRIIDALMSFPYVLLALTIAALLGSGIGNIMLALGISMMPPYARVMCGQALSIRETDYILAERSMGSQNRRIIFRHILPNCFPPMIVIMTMMIGWTILAEAGLSFLGIGIKPPTAAWGSMVYDGYTFLLTRPILSFVPGLAIMIVVFAFNMVGDGVRDAIDPRLRGVL
jgi:ABC-type dipeptide/oligopeptide/nickel transport system permease subunit